LVRKTEERLATLGVFSTVTVGFEDPTVPAREKMVVITVQEKKPQYLDVRPGFSTGEGFRTSFEYGHRNLGGEAIQLTLRSQLGYLPTPLILEDDVRRKYEELSVGERLERRNSVILEFPEIGLGPLFRFSVEGVDVRDNARDFGLTRDAVILTLNYRPERRFSAHGGPSLELNDAEIFGNEQKDALNDYITKNPAQRDRFRVPQGKTVAAAFRVGFSWDRRDNPFDATRGTLLQVDAEPVIANPAGGQAAGGSSVFAATESRFVRFTNRLAGYIRLSEHGLALAASFRWGLIQQLTSTSRTYPDRLFFLGGVDSLRGFLQDSMMPEDIAQELLRAGPPRSATPCPVAPPLTCGAPSNLTLDKVVIRGGDVFLNPRLELRIPLSSSVQTAVFLDSGNLWTDPDQVEKNFVLRYAAGTGIRFETPIGPLVFDYGFNLERVLDQLDPGRQNQRYWEDLGAFHFSIGVF
jgi:outer membrane protein assembly factor BamA